MGAAAGLHRALPFIPCQERGPVDTRSQPQQLFLVPPHITHRQAFSLLNSFCVSIGTGGGGGGEGGRGLSHGRELHLRPFGSSWQRLAELFPLLLTPLYRPLPERRVPPTVIFNAFILALNLSRVVIRFSRERSVRAGLPAYS